MPVDRVPVDRTGDASDAEILEFMKNLRESWYDRFGLTEYEFTKNDISAIEKIREDKYASGEWTLGRTPRYSYRNSKRFPGGGVSVFVNVKGGIIEDVKIAGDFLALRPVAAIEEKFIGVPFNAKALAGAVSESDLHRTLGSITKEELLSVFQ
jgi:lipoate-protein ligase A